MSKTKNTLIFGLIITTTFALALGLLYWRDTIYLSEGDNDIPSDIPSDIPFVGPTTGMFIRPIIPNPNVDGNVVVEWTGVYISSFIICRSVNGSNFIDIGEQMKSDYVSRDGGYFRYEYIDEILQSGTYTYKIKGTIVNEDGALIGVFTSNIQSVIVQLNI